MAGLVGTGSAEGLNEFCDWLIKKGLMKSSAVEPLRSATKQIVATVDEGMDPSEVILTDPSFNPDAYMDRFEKLAGEKYAPDSLGAYRRRFKRAVELYRQYVEQGAANFKPPATRTVRRRPVREAGSNPGGAPRAINAPTPLEAPADLIDYPFPLRSGQIAHLHLPPRLERDDADRMAVVIRALVFEPQRQIGQGDDDPD